MSSDTSLEKKRAQTVKFLTSIFGIKAPSVEEMGPYMAGDVPIGQNQPEFWADAPWRIEPDHDEIPLLFLIREGNVEAPAKGPWRLDLLKVEYRNAQGIWDPVCALLPQDLPGIDDKGNIERTFWSFGTRILLTDLKGVARGHSVHLRATFMGSFYPYAKPAPTEVYLETFLAEHPLPLSRAAGADGARHWFHGDTHYHSSYTMDIKEFGNPVPETRAAAQAIGLDWLVVTDHSCDLDETDAEAGPATRWARLKEEVSSPEISDEKFRCILGEEITLASKGERFVHMLAFGAMEDMVEGGFLPFDGDLLSELLQEGLAEWFEAIAKKGGFPEGEAGRLFGTIHPFDEVMDMLPEETLKFAAHPFQFAQPPPPGTWHDEDLDNLRLTGYEFWNGRTRRSSRLTLNPFTRKNWQDTKKLAKKDQARMAKIRRWAETRWEPALRSGLLSWSAAEPLPTRRPVFVAGSDAHGSFNFSVGMGWDYRSRLMVDDNALGRARTVVHLPDHQAHTVPEIEHILAAIRKGACVVTDGPVLEFSLRHSGKVAHLGDAIDVSGAGDLEMEVVAHSTPEFGAVEQVEVVTCFNGHRKSRQTLVQAGASETIELNGLQGYCRLYAETVGPGDERFCCFTNPIWARMTDGKKRRLRVRVASP
jgi:hypothetical protein